MILFVDGCMRAASRTRALAEKFLKSIAVGDEIKTENVSSLDIAPLDERTLTLRDEDIHSGRLDGEKYALAKRFASSDEIVIAAPCWDTTYPAKLKAYFENICVNGITFAYNSDGSLKKLCKAENITYICTVGGFLKENSALECGIKELAGLFGITDVRFYAAQGIDVFPDKIGQITDDALSKMLEDRRK